MLELTQYAKKMVRRIIDTGVALNRSFDEWLEDTNKVLEAENRMAMLSSYEHVFAFRETAKKLAMISSAPETETYLMYIEEAISMLDRGDDPAEVLWHFDMLLEKELRGVSKNDA